MEEAIKIIIEMLCQHGQQSTQPFEAAISFLQINNIIKNQKSIMEESTKELIKTLCRTGHQHVREGRPVLADKCFVIIHNICVGSMPLDEQLQEVGIQKNN